jgi:hypothetical protein
MKDHRIPPHSNSDGVVSIGETVRTDEKSFRVRKYPDAQHGEEIDEVTQVGQEVVVATLVIRVISYRHEIEQLRGIPNVEPFWISSDNVATEEDIQNSSNEGELLP